MRQEQMNRGWSVSVLACQSDVATRNRLTCVVFYLPSNSSSNVREHLPTNACSEQRQVEIPVSLCRCRCTAGSGTPLSSAITGKGLYLKQWEKTITKVCAESGKVEQPCGKLPPVSSVWLVPDGGLAACRSCSG